MATLTASPSHTRTVSSSLTPTNDRSASSNGQHPKGVIPLPANPAAVRGSGLRRKKSLRPVNKAGASAREASSAEHQSLESAVSQAVSKVGEEIVTTSEEFLDAVDSVMEDGPAGMRRRKSSAGKANSRLSRRRALVMCLALGMVRPCATNMQQNNDLRRTVSEAIPKTVSTSFQVPSTLVSQVSLATTVKQTNFRGEQEDMQKLTTLQ